MRITFVLCLLRSFLIIKKVNQSSHSVGDITAFLYFQYVYLYVYIYNPSLFYRKFLNARSKACRFASQLEIVSNSHVSILCTVFIAIYYTKCNIFNFKYVS